MNEKYENYFLFLSPFLLIGDIFPLDNEGDGGVGGVSRPFPFSICGKPKTNGCPNGRVPDAS